MIRSSSDEEARIYNVSISGAIIQKSEGFSTQPAGCENTGIRPSMWVDEKEMEKYPDAGWVYLNADALEVPFSEVSEPPESDMPNAIRCVWHGSYPQSEVKDSDLCAMLDGLDDSVWDEKGDATCQGERYRRLKGKEAYHPYPTGFAFYNWKNDYESYHYFKYEPIKWRVIIVSGENALLMADQALDAMDYSIDGNDAVEWEKSLLYDFMQKNMDASYGIPTDDELINEEAGFLGQNRYDIARVAYCSDYARAQGIYTTQEAYSKRRCRYWLYDSEKQVAGWVEMAGHYSGRPTEEGTDYIGVRPVLRIKADELTEYPDAGWILKNGLVLEQSLSASTVPALETSMEPPEETMDAPEASRSPATSPSIVYDPEVSQFPMVSASPTVGNDAETSQFPTISPAFTFVPETSEPPSASPSLAYEPETSEPPSASPTPAQEQTFGYSPFPTPLFIYAYGSATGQSSTPSPSPTSESSSLNKSAELDTIPAASEPKLICKGHFSQKAVCICHGNILGQRGQLVRKRKEF